MSTCDIECLDCTNPPVIRLDEEVSDDEDVTAWCAECAVCPVRGCERQMAYEVDWIVHSGGQPIAMCRSLCAAHADEFMRAGGDCACSQAHPDTRTKIAYVEIGIVGGEKVHMVAPDAPDD